MQGPSVAYVSKFYQCIAVHEQDAVPLLSICVLLAGILDGMRVSDANESDPPQGQNDTQPASNFSSRNNSRFTSPTRESRPIAIDGHDTPGKGPAKSKTRKKASKPSFPAPTLAMVQQAFNMLDPHGSGAVNPYALREVMPPLHFSPSSLSPHSMTISLGHTKDNHRSLTSEAHFVDSCQTLFRVRHL